MHQLWYTLLECYVRADSLGCSCCSRLQKVGFETDELLERFFTFLQVRDAHMIVQKSVLIARMQAIDVTCLNAAMLVGSRVSVYVCSNHAHRQRRACHVWPSHLSVWTPSFARVAVVKCCVSCSLATRNRLSKISKSTHNTQVHTKAVAIIHMQALVIILILCECLCVSCM
jgi:hypothetical protein